MGRGTFCMATTDAVRFCRRGSLIAGRLAARQAGKPLGERVKAAWEWAAVLGQVEVYGWTRLDIRCCARARIRNGPRGNGPYLNQ